MKKEITYTLIFVVGAIVGSASTMRYFKTKYEQIAQEEINSVKETFLKSKDSKPSEEESITESEDDISEDKETLEELVKSQDYTAYSKSVEKKEEEPLKKKPYVISPMQVGDDDYDCITFTLYSNGVLTNEQDEVIEGGELESLLGGKEVYKHFGDYEDDVLYVRNDKLKTDFEILRVLDSYEVDDSE